MLYHLLDPDAHGPTRHQTQAIARFYNAYGSGNAESVYVQAAHTKETNLMAEEFETNF